jgi:hypothetical protein
MSGRTIGNLILMTLICVVVFIVFMAVRPTKASAQNLSHAHIHFTVRIALKAGIFQSGHHRPVIWPTKLAVQQRQNGSHSEREPCQNEYDSAGWRRHGK